VAPLQLGGLRGKQSTPSIGWEVPVRSRRSASGSGTERADVIEAGDKAMVRYAHLACVQHLNLGESTLIDCD
jgi:hypothetical protein